MSLEPTREPKAGNVIKPHLKIASILSLAAPLLLFAPMSANASSTLLSGYGGPGAGGQAILGSMLLNTPGGGSAAGGGEGAGPTASPAVSSPQAGVGSTGSGAAPGTHRRSHSGRGATVSPVNTTPEATAGQTVADQLASSEGADAFGLTGADVWIFLLALVALACVAVLMKRLARLQR